MAFSSCASRNNGFTVAGRRRRNAVFSSQRSSVDRSGVVKQRCLRNVTFWCLFLHGAGFYLDPPARLVRISCLKPIQLHQEHVENVDIGCSGDGSLVSYTFQERYADRLPQWLLDKCYECGWSRPTRIQAKVLDAVLSNGLSDVIVQSETGSGKTLAFLLPCLASIDASRSSVQSLIVVPTRELGLQISRVAKRLASASTDNKIMVMSVLQGSQNRRQRAWAWAEPPHLVIGTPEELCMMIRSGGIKRYNSIKFLIVDEVDACFLNNYGKFASGQVQFSGTPLHELLSKHLSPTFDDGKEAVAMDSDSAAATVGPVSIRPILTSRCTIFCSATIPQHRYFAKQCLQNQWMLQTPTYISLRSGSQHLPSQIKHGYIVTAGADKKLAALRRVLKKIMSSCRHRNESTRVLVFSDANRPMEEMAKAIAEDIDGFYWNEQSASSAHSVGSTGNIAPKALISVLRYEDSLSQRAAAMDAITGTFRKDSSSSSRADFTPIVDASSNVVLRVLLSTDLAARGLDIVDISYIVQVDLPENADTYVHRAGRTGRFGRSGQVISIITSEQEFVLNRLTNQLQVDITCIARQAATNTDASE
jgi:superfamily II DNA/RNA helicase